MSTAPATREVVCRVVNRDHWRQDDRGELRPVLLVALAAETKAGEVAGLYSAMDCGAYWIVHKMGSQPKTHKVGVDGHLQRQAVSCTCEAATYHPELKCKHQRATDALMNPSEESR